MGTDWARFRLSEPADPAGLAAFRILFGLLMLGATIRFWFYGWIESIYLKPDYHFTYILFDWVVVPDPVWLYLLFVVIGVSSLAIALGVYTQISAGIFWLTFTYAELMEKAAYLNHYYLVSLLSFLLIFVRTDLVWAMKPTGWSPASASIPKGAYWFMRGQASVVYFFAGFAKLNGDWLLHAQPLATWLQNFAHLPVLGPYLTQSVTAYLMSWVGCLFDLTIWGFLLWKPTRKIAAMVAISFHVSVWILFPIGVFSWVMILVITLFFDPSWPRRRWLAHRWDHNLMLSRGGSQPLVSRVWVVSAVFWLCLQCAIPLRFLAYQGPVNWTEEGFRFSWRVMLIEKTGLLEYRIEMEDPNRSIRVHPRQRLTEFQFRMLATQPDMILQYARSLADEYQNDDAHVVRVYADSFVAFNGRPSQRYIRPDVNLADPEVSVGAVMMPINADQDPL